MIQVIQLILIIIGVALIIIFYRSHSCKMVYHKSDIDNREYLVRDLPDKQNASNMLAFIKNNIYKITTYLHENKDKYPDYKDYIDQLHSKVYKSSGIIINESDDSNKYTSYSVNKGEQLIFCLRSRTTKKIHSSNIIMYVVLHEISHVACPEYGHTELFKKIFAFITSVAISINLYEKVDFYENPTEYCGLTITESII